MSLPVKRLQLQQLQHRVQRFKTRTSMRSVRPSVPTRHQSVHSSKTRIGVISVSAVPKKTHMNVKISRMSIWFYTATRCNKRRLWHVLKLRIQIWNSCATRMFRTTRGFVRTSRTRGSISSVMDSMIHLSRLRVRPSDFEIQNGAEPGPEGRAHAPACPSMKRSASRAAWQPRPADVMAWRNLLSSTSPAAKIPGTFVAVLPGLQRT